MSFVGDPNSFLITEKENKESSVATARSSLNKSQRIQDYQEIIEEDDFPVVVEVSRVT
jgi:hypothetical protein